MKNIIFDWSGVVKDAVDVELWKVNKAFNKFGINSISMEEFKENFRLPYMVFYSKYLPDVTKEQQDAYYKEISLSDECPHSHPFPGIINLIKKLKEEGNYLAIVSSDLPETLFSEMKEYGLENIFENVDMNVHDKTKSVRDLIEKNNFGKSITYFIGDTNHEIEVTKTLGIKSIAVTWGTCTEKNLRLENPDFVVHDVKELKDILHS